MSTVQEKRKSKRMGINVTIKLQKLGARSAASPDLKADEFEVSVTNISKDGLAFKTKEMLPLNSYYDAKVILWTKETFDTVIEVVRMENFGEDETLYGCRFIGISSSDQFKIDVYQIVSGN